MKHVLYHDRDVHCGPVNLYLDVTIKDLDGTPEQRAFIKNAAAQKWAVGLVQRGSGGVTLFAYSRATAPADELALIGSIITTIARPQTVQVTTESDAWRKF